MASIFSIGVSGLNAAKASLNVTSHNISNVNTAGYNRQTLEQATALPLFEGYGFVGSGVSMTTVSRVFDDFREKQLRSVTTREAFLDLQSTALQDLDNLVADANAGLTSVLQGFFGSLQTLSTQPSSAAARQTVLSQSQALVGRVASIAGRLEELRQGMGTYASSAVDSINSYASQVADLNDQIGRLRQSGDRAPNDLMDRRDYLVMELSKMVKTDVVPQSDGSYSLFIGQGQSLVLGNQTNKMALTRNDPLIPDKMTLTLGGLPMDSTQLAGGRLAGVMQVLDEDISRMQTDLGRFAVELSDAVNRQHALGVDQMGASAAGTLYFSDLTAERTAAEASGVSKEVQTYQMRTALAKFSLVVNDPARIAVSSGVKSGTAVPVAIGETPQGKPSITSIWQVANMHSSATPALDTNKTFAQVISPATGLTLRYTPGGTPTPYSVDAVAGLTISAISLDGAQSGVYQFTVQNGSDKMTLKFKPEGAAATAQTFALSARTDASAGLDNANLLEMGRLQTKPLMRATPSSGNSYIPSLADTPTVNVQSFYGQMVSYVGNRANVVDIGLKAQQAAKQEIQMAKESVSGVNLDEEAANLIRFQQAYQASSKVLQIAQDMFKQVMDIR